ncbi:aspartyl protease family protein [Sphingomonas jejuensis]|uniref:Aspartyl protease family protein n=1 Tax=Sphingomonas jejuensis TaxID=904715 RepID=A0ABX0XJI4_9SPHN|nr:TIGR02281 family clan AA aspartic protease [Sphingomonas jejuensis]NJC33494.1 aspartyl protease family protein [Sphingomonas jejuensis]
MSSDQAVQLAWAIGAIVLVASSLSLRRIGLGATLKMIGTWILLFGVVIVAASYRTELGLFWNRITGELSGQKTEVVGGELRVELSPDGHFWIDASINGARTRFLVDTGATFTAVSGNTVRDAGLSVDESGFPVLISTANGDVAARRLRLPEVRIGSIVVRDLGAITSPAFGQINVIGMNFLSGLESWRVEGRTLIMVPAPKAPAELTQNLHNVYYRTHENG